MTQIEDVQNRLCKNLSKGYKQRVGIAQAILGNPEVIILDEPTVGLDPKQIVEIRDLIRSLGKEHTVILSSHILSEVQAVCQTILIINKGKLVACDTAENLENYFSGKLELKLTADCGAERAEQIIAGLEGLEIVSAEEADGKTVLVVSTAREDADDVCREVSLGFAANGVALMGMTTSKASLEDVFMKLTEDDGVQAGADGEADAEALAEAAEQLSEVLENQAPDDAEEEVKADESNI